MHGDIKAHESWTNSSILGTTETHNIHQCHCTVDARININRLAGDSVLGHAISLKRVVSAWGYQFYLNKSLIVYIYL